MTAIMGEAGLVAIEVGSRRWDTFSGAASASSAAAFGTRGIVVRAEKPSPVGETHNARGNRGEEGDDE
jgi:hypothetical protein